MQAGWHSNNAKSAWLGTKLAHRDLALVGRYASNSPDQGFLSPSMIQGEHSRMAGNQAPAGQPNAQVARVGPPDHGEINRPRPIRTVACAAFVICLAAAAGFHGSPAPANAIPALTKKPCRWHCERQWLDGDIHPHAAGNALRSLVSSLSTGPPPSFRSNSITVSNLAESTA
jgi:hypothetical protein